MKPPASLWTNSRFYILATGIVLAAVVWLGIASANAGDLASVRLSETYGFIALGYLLVTLLISPLLQLWSASAYAAGLKHARRALGVSAFGFAVLHAAIGLFGQLGGLAGLGFLPPSFLSGVILGLVALMILFVLAATSFDAVIKRLTFPRWKRLQRLVYLALALIVVHMVMIGSHFSHGIETIGGLAIGAIMVVIVAEIVRLGLGAARRPGKGQAS